MFKGRENFNAEDLINRTYLRENGIYEISLEQFKQLGGTHGVIQSRYLAWDYEEGMFYDTLNEHFVRDVSIYSFPQEIQSSIHNDDVRPIKYFFDENTGTRYQIQLIHTGQTFAPDPFGNNLGQIFWREKILFV